MNRKSWFKRLFIVNNVLIIVCVLSMLLFLPFPWFIKLFGIIFITLLGGTSYLFIDIWLDNKK